MRNPTISSISCLLSLSLLITSLSTQWANSSQLHEPSIEDASILHNGDLFSLGRHLQQVPPSPIVVTIENRTLILAQSRTERINPLKNFEKYDKGWNITNIDYWASVGFTGAPGFLISAAWLALGILLLLLLCFCCCCCRSSAKGHHQGGTTFPLLALLLFTTAALVGCILLYLGQGKFSSELSDTLDYVVGQAEVVVGDLRNVSSALAKAPSISVMDWSLSDSQKEKVRQTNTNLTNAANKLDTKTEENSQDIKQVIRKVSISMIVVSATLVLLVLLGLFFAVTGAGPLVYMLVILGWFIVVITWILCGVYIILNTTMGDTCVAMGEWVENPSAISSLDEILPCMDVATAQKTLDETNELANETAIGINGVISRTLNRIPSQDSLVPLLCISDQSTAGCVTFEAAPKAWEPHVCTGLSPNGICTTGQRIPQDVYQQMTTSVEIIWTLQTYVPFLVGVKDCTFVRAVFSDIKDDNCPELKRWTKYQYIGLSLASSGTMLSVLVWIVYTRRRHKGHGWFNRHKHHHDAQSTQPIIDSPDNK